MKRAKAEPEAEKGIGDLSSVKAVGELLARQTAATIASELELRLCQKENYHYEWLRDHYGSKNPIFQIYNKMNSEERRLELIKSDWESRRKAVIKDALEMYIKALSEHTA